jgi:hypothetical protein
MRDQAREVKEVREIARSGGRTVVARSGNEIG